MIPVRPPRQRVPRVKDKAYTQSFRGAECLAKAMLGCSGDVVAAHFTIGGYTPGETPDPQGTGGKTHDFWTAPLCDAHHSICDGNQRSFWLTLLTEDVSLLRDVMRVYLEKRHREWKDG